MKQELGKMMVMNSIQETQLVAHKKSNISLILMLIFIGLVAKAAQSHATAAEEVTDRAEATVIDADRRMDLGDDVQDRTRTPEPEYYTVLDPQ